MLDLLNRLDRPIKEFPTITWKYLLTSWWPFLCGLLVLAGCSALQPTPYSEEYTLTNVTVVFLDEQTLRDRYQALSGHSGVLFSAFSPTPSVKTVRGFYDYRTKTIYCPKMDFLACGHELHHATLGRFHVDH
jgi:hypothetical protein